MKIHIISKSTPEQLPPIISLAFNCLDLGYKIIIITQNISKSSYNLFYSKSIDICNLNNKTLRIPIIGKIIHWVRFYFYINKYLKNANSNDIIWISGADTLLLINSYNLKKHKIYFQLNELCDELPIYRYFIKKKIKYCYKVIVPETNRTHIAQVLYNLKELPQLLPNKPYDFEKTSLETNPQIHNYIKLLKDLKKNGKILFIYQGFISDLRDLTQICKAIEKYKNKCSLVLMGEDEGALTKYRKLCPEIIHIPFLPAPWHLEITAICDIGILIYLPVSLNNIYCAPNKIWEYSKYGLALLGNDIPGLSFIDNINIGKTIKLHDLSDVESKISHLSINYQYLKEQSLLFYNSLDMKEAISDIIEQ